MISHWAQARIDMAEASYRRREARKAGLSQDAIMGRQLSQVNLGAGVYEDAIPDWHELLGSMPLPPVSETHG